MKKSLFALLLLAFTADFLVQFPARVFAGPEDVQAAMQPKGGTDEYAAGGFFLVDSDRVDLHRFAARLRR